MSTSLRTVSTARYGLLAFLLLGTACPDDPTIPPVDTEGETGTTTGDDAPPVTTMIDPDTTAGMDTTEGGTTEGETEGATTEGATTEGAMCGNGTAEDGEDCDGEDLGGEDCESQGFGGGALQCADDCTFDTSECTKAPVCGDDVADDGQACDGTDLAGEDCMSQGFAGGTLACLADCTGFDTEACTAGASNCCEASLGMGCDDPTCETDICALDDYCCATEWDQICADAATGADGNGNACAVCPAPVCGNDVIEFGEVCDGAELDGEDCTTQGFMSGMLACAGDCLTFDTTGCMDPIQNPDCCAPAMAGIGGCADAACEATICGADAFCCDTEWDQVCADAAALEPDCAGMGTCPPPAVCGDAMIGVGEVCDGANLDGLTCVLLGYTGGVLACEADCTALDLGACIADLTCSEQNIGGATGAAVAMGTTVGADNDLDASCGGTGGPDRVITFTPAMAGTYTFDTLGSAYDTKLAIFVSCDEAAELACNDDEPGGTLQSEISIDLLAGQAVLLVVDGFNGATGNWTLNITGP